MKKHIRLAVTAAALWASFSTQRSDAVELNVPNVPQGVVAPLILDMPPIPGIFGLAMATYQPSYDLVGPKGDKLPIPFNGQGTGVAARFLLSYGELFGGHFYQQIVLPFVKVDTTIFGQSSSDFGLANFTAAPALVVWNLTDRQSFALGLEIATPWGTPRVTTGYATWAPTAAYRYNDPEGFTAAVMPRILLNSYHDKTQYQSPTAFLVDFNTGWNFSKDLRIGLAGSFATQFEEDMQFGSKLRGTKFANLMLGPSITYNFGNFVMIFSYQPSIYTRNYATQNLFTLAIAAPLYIPPPPATR